MADIKALAELVREWREHSHGWNQPSQITGRPLSRGIAWGYQWAADDLERLIAPDVVRAQLAACPEVQNTDEQP